MNLLNFTQFINEARISPHAGQRFDQRVHETLVVDLPNEAKERLRSMGLKPYQISTEAAALIKEEFTKKAKALETSEFGDGNVATVILFPYLKIGDNRFKMKLTVSSYDDESSKTTMKTYHGEKICCYVADNVVTTIKVLPGSFTDDQIKADMDEHLERQGKLGSSRVISPEGSKFEIEVSSDGSVNPYDRRDLIGLINRGEKEYALAPGRMIKVFLPFMGGMTEAEVIEVLNRNNARADGFIKVAVQIEDGRKIPKTLKPGDPISIPAKDGGWEHFSVADSLFVDYANRGGAFSIKIV